MKRLFVVAFVLSTFILLGYSTATHAERVFDDVETIIYKLFKAAGMGAFYAFSQ